MEWGVASFGHIKTLQLLYGTGGMEGAKQEVRMRSGEPSISVPLVSPCREPGHSSQSCDNNGICLNNLGTGEQ